MTQRTYDKEFKINVVKLYLTNKDKKSINSLAKDLGIATSCLSHWIRNYRDHEEKSFVGSGNSINQEMRELKRELLVRQERDILKKAVAHLFRTPRQRYEFMKNNKEEFCIDKMAEVLGVSRAGYYGFLKRLASNSCYAVKVARSVKLI